MYSDVDMLSALQGLIKIPSISGQNASAEYPYGKEVDDALTYTLDLSRYLGMRTVKRQRKVAWAEIGQGDHMIAVVPHLDVVPIGEGWNVEPFGGIIKNGRLYGRGASDNKGPAITCLYAAADVAEYFGDKIPGRIRIIFGQSEETGIWSDLDYYREHEELPYAGFTPDAEFPALCGEKGVLWLELSIPLERSGLLSFNGGSACNIVCSQCQASYFTPSGKIETLTEEGRAAHATAPESGINAISLLMEQMHPVVKSPLIDFYQAYIGQTCHGEKLGINFEDSLSGQTTVCVGKISSDDKKITFTLDIRYPVTCDGSFILTQITQAAKRYELSLHILKNAAPLYRSLDDPILKQLMDAYREETGDKGVPIVIGGSTYARALPNIVGFGAAFPGREHTEHQDDEYIVLEDLFKQRKIYRNALLRLLGSLESK